MKRIISLLLSLLLVLDILPACAENAYPACQGIVTDLADVLDDSAKKDLEKLSERYSDAMDGQLYVVTRHFLGGKDVNAYAKALFDAWELAGSDVLLLMVIGEESYAMAIGSEAMLMLPQETVDTYFGSYFHQPFMARQYSKAAGDMTVETLSRIVSDWGGKLNTAGLFGTQSQKTIDMDAIEQELSGMFSTLFENRPEEAEDNNEKGTLLQEDKSTGISLWKVILILIILRTIFKKRRRRNFGHRPYR